MERLSINGKAVELAGPMPLLDYLNRLGVNPQAVAVEVNGEILKRDAYAACVLRGGDDVEIVRMVGGGLLHTARETADRFLVSRLGAGD